MRGILDGAGWANGRCTAIDVECVFPGNALVRYFTRLGPVSQALRATDEITRNQAIERILEAFEPYRRGADVCFTAACWMVSAEAPAA